MLEIALAGAAVLGSLAVCLLAIRMLWDRPLQTRGGAGLGLTVVHMALSLMLPALGWIVIRPAKPLLFAFSVLAFYLCSLIILVVTIIRWLRAGNSRRNGSPDDPVV